MAEKDANSSVGAHYTGMSVRGIAEMFHFPKPTVHIILHNFKEAYRVSPRSPKLSESDQCRLVGDCGRKSSLLSKFTAQMRPVTLEGVSEFTIRRMYSHGK